MSPEDWLHILLFYSKQAPGDSVICKTIWLQQDVSKLPPFMRRSRPAVSSPVLFNIQAVAVINLSIYLLGMLLQIHSLQ